MNVAIAILPGGCTVECSGRLGRLPGARPRDPRGIERAARNPACQVLRALLMAGISPATASAKVYGEVPREGQSPFALAAGNRFEALLTANGAARLLALYRDAGRLEQAECTVVAIPDLAPGGGAAVMTRRLRLTARYL